MKKTFVLLSLALIVMLSACQAPPAAPTVTQASSSIAPTTAPAAPPATPTTAPTAGASPTVAPTSAAGPCTDSASFVADVTIPDYSHFDQHETFTKTWRVKNTGTCTWTTDYKAVYSRGDALGAPLSIPLAETAPGATVDISADMAAPGTDGKFQIFYQLTNATGNPMPIDAGDALWALITVGKFVAFAPPTATPGAPATAVPTGTSGSGTSGGPTPGGGLSPAGCVVNANPDFVTQTMTLINAARAANNVPALTLNAQLAAAAQGHSEDMACNNFLAHNGWNGSTPASRIAAAGYAGSTTRENIYAQPPQYGGNPQTAVDWWMGDQIHRDAILDPQVKDIGVGYAAYSRADLVGYFTVDFGGP